VANDERTAKRVSDALGTATELRAMKNYAGHRLSPWLGHLMVSRQETARPLLTPGEVMQLPPSDEIVLVSGLPPIRAKKARYYEDRRLTARLLPPPQLERIARDTMPRAASSLDADDWCGLMPRHEKAASEEGVAAAPSDDEDPANGGIRREPELPEHEAITPEKPISAVAPENFLADESDDDEAIKARILRSQARSLARQASMDPDDGIPL
jgi:type IV secretion system protein VirD4